MPTIEEAKSEQRLNREAHESHLIRTRNRIAFWNRELERPLSDSVRQTIKDEIVLLEKQLRIPLTERSIKQIERERAGAAPTMAEVGFGSMMRKLQEEIVELKARLGGHDGAVSKPEAAAQAKP